MFWFILAGLLGAHGIYRLFWPEQAFYFAERLKYQYPQEPSIFRLRLLRTTGLLAILVGAGLAWMGLHG